MLSPGAAGRVVEDGEAKLLTQQQQMKEHVSAQQLSQSAINEAVYGTADVSAAPPRPAFRAAGTKGVAYRLSNATSVLPQAYDGGAKGTCGKKKLAPKSDAGRDTEPPYALEYEASALPSEYPRASSVPLAPLEGARPSATAGLPASAVSMPSQSLHELRSTISKQVSGSTARVAAAFAKRDHARQGKLAPADFAASIRDLGVSCQTSDMSGITTANQDLSSDTVDYLAFVASLEPQLGLAAAAAASRPAVAPSLPRSKLDSRRLYGVYAQGQRSQIDFGAAAASGSPGGASGIDGGAEAAAQSTLLHEHAAFAAAGVGAERKKEPNGRRHFIGGDEGSPPGPAQPIGGTAAAGVASDATAAHAANAEAIIFGSDGRPPSPRRQRGGPEGTNPSLKSNADRLIFGHAMGRGGAADSSAAGAPAAAFAPEIPPSHRHQAKSPGAHNHAVVDKLIFSRELDEAALDPPLAAAPSYAGAAGLTSPSVARVMRDKRHSINAFDGPHGLPAPPPATPRPHTQSTADEIVFGRDPDGSSKLPSTTTHPEAEAARASGAAGQYTPRESSSARKAAFHAPPDVVLQSSAPSLDTMLACQQSASQQSLNDSHNVSATIEGWADSTTSMDDPPPRHSMSRRRSIPGRTSVQGAPFGTCDPSATPTTPRGTPSRAMLPQSPAGLPPRPASASHAEPRGCKVLRLSQSPPVPSPRSTSAYQGACGPSAVTRKAPFATVSDQAAPASAAATPSALSPTTPSRSAGQGSFCRTPSQLGSLSGFGPTVGPNAYSPGAAGQHSSARLPTGALPSSQRAHTWGAPQGAGDAAGRSTCGLTAQQRKYGGQISQMGGLG